MTAGSLSPVCADAASSVTALLPATTAPPDPARRIGFLRAVLLFWLLPKRFGPHLAVGSFKACLAAHALSLLLPLVILYLLFGVPWPSSPSDVPTPNEPPATFRENLARIVLREAIDSAQGRAGPSWVPSVLTFGSIPMFELLILMIGTAAMPFAAGGDPAFSVWKRSVKNAYWCTTILMPLSLAASGLLYFDRRVPDIFRVDLPTALPKIGAYLLAALLAVLLVRAIVVGAHRYVGPANGPAFAPREPRCDDCGYLIFSLPLDARCPECGLPVRDSLPGGRRGPTAWERREFQPRGFLEAMRMQWGVLRGTAFFRLVPVHAGLSAAKHFWWVTWAAMILVALIILRAGMDWAAQAVRSLPPRAWFPPPGENVELLWMPLSLGFMLVPLVAQALMMSGACLWAQFRYRIPDYRTSAAVCYYASPLMWPFVLAALAVAVMSLGSIRILISRQSLRTFDFGGLEIGVEDIALGAGIVVLLAAVGFWWLRLLRALRSVRFANV